MTKSEMRGADWLVAGLKEAGTQTIFSLSGNQIMPVYDAVYGTGMRIIHTRHEGAAVYMAEAAAQMTGTVGIALLTAGPGFANGLSAMYTRASQKRQWLYSPAILRATGMVMALSRNSISVMPQRAMVKATFRARQGAELLSDIRNAIAIAKSGRPGPVHLALPDDVLREVSETAASTSVVPAPSPDGSLSSSDLTAIGAHLSEAQRPLIVMGPQFCRPAAKAQVASLIDKLNIPIVTFESPRGLRAPRLGAFAEVLGEADAILSVGKPLNFMVGFADQSALDSSCKIVQIDPDKDVLARDADRCGERIQQQIHLSAHAALSGLDGLDGKPHSNNSWRQDVLDAVGYRPPAWDSASAADNTIGPIQLANALKPHLSSQPDASFIIDGGEIGQWCQAILDSEYAMINGPSGAIGGAIPYAIGAKACRPDQAAITILGDGTAGFYLAEFETAVRENLPIVVIIGNDAKWNAEHQIQIRDYGADRTFGCELTQARYDGVAEMLGGHGELVQSYDQLGPALERAFQSGKPACVNIMLEGQAAPAISRG